MKDRLGRCYLSLPQHERCFQMLGVHPKPLYPLEPAKYKSCWGVDFSQQQHCITEPACGRARVQSGLHTWDNSETARTQNQRRKSHQKLLQRGV